MVVLKRKKRLRVALEYAPNKAVPKNPKYKDRKSVVGRFEIVKLREEMGRFECWCNLLIPLVGKTATIYLNYPIGYIKNERHLWQKLNASARKKARSMLY